MARGRCSRLMGADGGAEILWMLEQAGERRKRQDARERMWPKSAGTEMWTLWWLGWHCAAPLALPSADAGRCGDYWTWPLPSPQSRLLSAKGGCAADGGGGDDGRKRWW